jgi:hypothetical protein
VVGVALRRALVCSGCGALILYMVGVALRKQMAPTNTQIVLCTTCRRVFHQCWLQADQTAGH